MTRPEIWRWVEIVAGIPQDSWRTAHYIEFWNVREKIRQAKLNSTFEALTRY